MAEVLLYHHAQGLTTGIQAFADELRGAGHTVHLPDLYDGRTFLTLEEGVAHASELGFQTVMDKGVALAQEYPTSLVYAGFSLGVMPAQQLAQTRQGAVGALLFEACLPASEIGDGWPSTLPVQIHGKAEDAFFAGEGDLDAARQLVSTAKEAELFVYPGSEHLFVDPSLPTYDAAAAALLTERVLEFLQRLS